MEITLDSRRPALVLRLTGRFDGDGASVFDAFVEALNRFDESWILDFSEVRYISSMGLRSLVRAEKRLRARNEMLVLAGLSRPVRQVLEMARLQNVLRLAASVEEALLLARSGSVAPDRALRTTRQGRTCATWLLGGQKPPRNLGCASGKHSPGSSRGTSWGHSRSRTWAVPLGSAGSARHAIRHVRRPGSS